jgi:hypothetical protein
LRTGLLAFFGIPMQSRKMLAGMANCAWTVLHQHHHYGWQIVDYNAQTLPEPIVPLTARCRPNTPSPAFRASQTALSRDRWCSVGGARLDGTGDFALPVPVG